MLDDVTIRPMTEEYILTRCLHRGPVSSASGAKAGSADAKALWAIARTYGAGGIVALDGDKTVGMVRCYPKALCGSMQDFVALCLQASPGGMSALVAAKGLPPLAQLADKTLVVHCLATGSPFQKSNPYQRKGLGSRMVRELLRWAEENGWQAVEARAVEDLGILYEHTGQAGKRFWEKLGFEAVSSESRTRGGLPGRVLKIAREQAAAQGLDPETATEWTMRLSLAAPEAADR